MLLNFHRAPLSGWQKISVILIPQSQMQWVLQAMDQISTVIDSNCVTMSSCKGQENDANDIKSRLSEEMAWLNKWILLPLTAHPQKCAQWRFHCSIFSNCRVVRRWSNESEWWVQPCSGNPASFLMSIACKTVGTSIMGTLARGRQRNLLSCFCPHCICL